MSPWLFRLIPYYYKSLSAMAPARAAGSAYQLFASTRRYPRPPSEKEAYEKAEKIWLKNGLRAYRWGSAKDPVIILLHGWNGRGTQLKAYSEPLSKLGYQVLGIDGPAHGESPGKRTNPRQFADALFSIQSEVGPFAALISHSFGAGCSVVAISEGLQVEKLVYIAGPCHYDGIVKRFAKRIGLDARAQALFFAKMEAVTGRGLDKMNIGELGRIRPVRALMVHDSDDKEVKIEEAEEIYKAWSEVRPDTQALFTTELGHVRILREPHVVAKVVEFISSN
jgi:pimeloyl-ACP methyl ester carboxylesterase